MFMLFKVLKAAFKDGSGSIDLNIAVLQLEGGCLHLPGVLREGHATALRVLELALAAPHVVVDKLKGSQQAPDKLETPSWWSAPTQHGPAPLITLALKCQPFTFYELQQGGFFSLPLLHLPKHASLHVQILGRERRAACSEMGAPH